MYRASAELAKANKTGLNQTSASGKHSETANLGQQSLILLAIKATLFTTHLKGDE